MTKLRVGGIVICSLLIMLLVNSGFAQGITIHSITTARELGQFGGYTLDGQNMVDSRAKLLNPANFGPSGTYPKSISIIDGYATTGSLTQVTSVPEGDIFFFGAFDLVDTPFAPFSEAEIDSLYQWSKRGGKVIIAASAPAPLLYNPAVLNAKWGFDIYAQLPNILLPTTAGNNSAIFNGPFGPVDTAFEGGSAQGFFEVSPFPMVILAVNSINIPTLILDCNTLDLITADVDVFTTVGAISVGNGINNEEDRFWANVIVFMDQLESPPVIVANGTTLSTGTYSAYQWYLNGAEIPDANSQSFSVNQNGSYTVQTTLKCGCILMSDTFVVNNVGNQYVIPNAFTPNGDGKNDVLYVISPDVAEMTLTIYDRWGEKVFESYNIHNGWDGNFKGKPLNAQTFMYYFEGTFANGESARSKGCITLLR